MEFRCLSDLNITTNKESRIGFAVEVATANELKRIYIDYGDWDEINETFYEWADVYAKINVRPEDAGREKLLVIGPSFGINLWSPVNSLLHGYRNYRHLGEASEPTLKRTLKRYMMDYAYMFVRRRRYSYYHRFTKEEQPGYVFSFHTLWYGVFADEAINKLRGEFMREARRLMTRFDGGFFYNDQPGVYQEFPKYRDYLQEYEDLIAMKRIPMNAYDKRSRKSWFVFNTPSVAGCHGWKLAEFLCEGKAIISTRLSNVMPGNFENGVHYLEANTREEMADAIIRLRDDKELVMTLKQNAFRYFEEYLTPEAVTKRILHKAALMD